MADLRHRSRTMIVIPGIALQQGKVAAAPAAVGGIADPLGCVRALVRDGAPFVHVEDLDLDRGEPQRAVYEALAADLRPFQVGGRIADTATAQALLALGAERVVAGALAFRDPKGTKQLAKQAAARLVVELELRDGKVAGADAPLAGALAGLGKLNLRTLLLRGEAWTPAQVAEIAAALDAAIWIGRHGAPEALAAALAEFGAQVTGAIAYAAP
jgi:hypothetical protein